MRKNRHIIQKNFETRDEVLKWVQDYSKSNNENCKIKLVPPQLEKIERGGFDYRQGKNANGQILVADPASIRRSEQAWDFNIILDEARRGAGAGGAFWIIG